MGKVIKEVIGTYIGFHIKVLKFSISRVSAGGFSDITSNHCFNSEIMHLLDKGVISQAGTFGISESGA
ncbi:hypothetical protein [Paenisporosarcina indica]|uniref:hypothetical protein n=1 Tax=Paenisporosarcina indica TaxID=650093 RepID=UPI00094FF40E|nr:hypothetical protein [Paenisporosarcina indica]